MRVLCLDIEGGYGGSSRSLHESLRHMDREIVIPEVWCRRDGPVLARYHALGISANTHPEMPHVSSLSRLSRNLIAYSRFVLKWRQSVEFRVRLADRAKCADVVHFNHEGLFLLARWLRPRTPARFTMHIRTILADTPFSRWQSRMVSSVADRLIFITENERNAFERLAQRETKGTVIYNIATRPDPLPQPHPAIPADGRFRLGSLSNFAIVRGTDRLVDIASALARAGRHDVLFVVAGHMEGADTRNPGGTLALRAAAAGLSGMFLFLGHVSEPERVIVACHALLKPTRNNDPWGRDIIEAMALGKPAITVGTWSRFVEPDVTGILLAKFDATQAAMQIARLADDPIYYARLSGAAADRISSLCSGQARAADLAATWRQALAT